LVIRFFFEACFTRCMAASSRLEERISVDRTIFVALILRRANNAGKIHARTKSHESRSECIHLDERHRGNFLSIATDAA
jgi:hypothetical protein